MNRILSVIVLFVTIIALLLAVYSAQQILDIRMELKMIQEETKVKQLLRRHGLADRFSVVFIKQDGSEWFERNGRLCKFK